MGVELSDTKYIIIVESDHFYPEGFIDKLIEAFHLSNQKVIRGKVLLINPSNIFELMHNKFMNLNESYLSIRYDMHAPSVWERETLINCLNNMTQLEGYSFDSAIADYLSNKPNKSI